MVDGRRSMVVCMIERGHPAATNAGEDHWAIRKQMKGSCSASTRQEPVAP
jgi:hypothetical protein